MDIAGFAAEIEALRRSAYATISHSDYLHMRRVERRGRLATLLGYLTVWLPPNPFTAVALSLGQSTRWLLAHHITHRGYDRIPGIPARYTSRGFARGWRRFVDWFDWIVPSAWDYEHNTLHHSYTGEDRDPDVVERHVEFLRALRVPLAVKYAFLTVLALTWKFTYYAPRTMSVLEPRTMRRRSGDHILHMSFTNALDLRSPTARAVWIRCYLPYAGFHFLLVPCLFLPLGTTAAFFVLLNKLLAECITNMHSFLVIGPNHTADDLYQFDFHYHGRPEFYATQVLSSANYHCGTEFVDYLSLWLNYQIEHHLFSDLPMSKYREIQPAVKSLCERHGLPYRQESVFKRFARMADVVVGRTSGRRLRSMSRSAAPA
jgi:fatty acid desaturase